MRPLETKTDTVLVETTMNKPTKNDGAVRSLCVGIIMDGNRRWAKEQGLSSLQGHAAGYAKAKEIIQYGFSQGVETFILYVFSTENWNRSKEEVGYLMDLLGGAFMHELEVLVREGVRITFIGDLSRLPENIRASAKKLEEESAQASQNKTLCLAISYGGRAELVAAVNMLLKEGKEEIQEQDLRAALWSANVPDPDLIIRTGGEERLSNFLPWQSVYSELFFTDTKWPAFTTEEFDSILVEFSTRERRRGK